MSAEKPPKPETIEKQAIPEIQAEAPVPVTPENQEVAMSPDPMQAERQLATDAAELAAVHERLGIPNASDIESYKQNFSPEQLEMIGKIRNAAQELLAEYPNHQDDEDWLKENGFSGFYVSSSGDPEQHERAYDRSRNEAHTKYTEYLKKIAYGTDFEIVGKKFLRDPKLYSFKQGDQKQVLGNEDFHYGIPDHEQSSVIKTLEKRAGIKIDDIFK